VPCSFSDMLWNSFRNFGALFLQVFQIKGVTLYCELLTINKLKEYTTFIW